MKIRIAKTKYAELRSNLSVSDRPAEQVMEAKYLGVTITSFECAFTKKENKSQRRIGQWVTSTTPYGAASI